MGVQQRRQRPVAKDEHRRRHAAEKIAVMMSAEAASLRARGRSPAPSARDTVAEAAMVRPMLIDMAKKVVKPT